MDIPLDRLVSAALVLDPTGKRILSDFLETQDLTAPVAKAIAVAGDPGPAFRILCDQAKRVKSRPAALSGIRVARSQGRLPSARVMQDAINDVLSATNKEVGQMLRDASHEVDPAIVRDRMKVWLRSEDPSLVESALWTVGYQGRAFIDLAPDVARSFSTSDSQPEQQSKIVPPRP